MAKYIIAGGVVGGIATAARLHRLDENAEIIICSFLSNSLHL